MENVSYYYHVRKQNGRTSQLTFRNHDERGDACHVVYRDKDRAILAHIRARIQEKLVHLNCRCRFEDDRLVLKFPIEVNTDYILEQINDISFTSYRYHPVDLRWRTLDEWRVRTYHRLPFLSKCKYSFKFYMRGKSVVIRTPFTPDQEIAFT